MAKVKENKQNLRLRSLLTRVEKINLSHDLVILE